MKLFLIAEIGINHNGDLKTCKDLIDVAVNSGCDAVKFQKRDIDQVYTKEFLDSPRESPWGKTQREQKEGLEFNLEEYLEINEYCKKFSAKDSSLLDELIKYTNEHEDKQRPHNH